MRRIFSQCQNIAVYERSSLAHAELFSKSLKHATVYAKQDKKNIKRIFKMFQCI